jgi:hypothetical protein
MNIDPTVLQILIDTSKSNAEHIAVLNHETGVLADQVSIIKWFLMANVTAWIAVIVPFIWKQITKSIK